MGKFKGKYFYIIIIAILIAQNIYLYKMTIQERDLKIKQQELVRKLEVEEKKAKVKKEEETSTFSVKTFGAKGDGEADDTFAIKAAIKKANKQGGGEVFLPQGIYIVSESLEIDEGITIKGESHQGTKIVFMGEGYAFHTVGTHLRIAFRDFRIMLTDSNSGIKIGDTGENLNREKGILPRQISLSNISISGLSTGQYGIRIMNASHVNMTGVRSAYGTGGTGLSIWNDYYNSGVMTFNDCTFGRVNSSDIGFEIDGENGAGLDSFSFNGTYFGGMNPIIIGKTVAVRNMNFNGIHVEGNENSDLIQIYNGKGISFSGVTLSGFGSKSNGFVFLNESEKVNIFGTEVNHFFGDIFYNKAGHSINNSIIQSASLTGDSKPSSQFKGNFQNVTRLVGDRLAISNIQTNNIFTDSGNKMDWGSKNPELDKSTEMSTKGDIRHNVDPKIIETKTKQYFIQGWKCIESGNPGKWVEMRAYLD